MYLFILAVSTYLYPHPLYIYICVCMCVCLSINTNTNTFFNKLMMLTNDSGLLFTKNQNLTSADDTGVGI